MKIGSFVQDIDGMLHGRIQGLGVGNIDVISEQVSSRDGQTYLRLLADPLHDPYEVGAAFPKEKNGTVYYSLSLDSPVFATPINALLYPDRDQPAKLNLIWNRPEVTPQPKAEAYNSNNGQKPRSFARQGTTPRVAP